jgi:hypothetical protein
VRVVEHPLQTGRGAFRQAGPATILCRAWCRCVSAWDAERQRTMRHRISNRISPHEWSLTDRMAHGAGRPPASSPQPKQLKSTPGGQRSLQENGGGPTQLWAEMWSGRALYVSAREVKGAGGYIIKRNGQNSAVGMPMTDILVEH